MKPRRSVVAESEVTCLAAWVETGANAVDDGAKMAKAQAAAEMIEGAIVLQ
jgi:hypothetical protein